MTTQQIHYFLEVARRLSFTNAAKALYIAQPTLSKQIAAMEDELGFKLFQRKGHRISLTSAGSLMRIELEKMEASLKTTLSQAQRLEEGTEGHISCALLDIMNPQLIALPVIERFKEKYPKVELEIVICGFQEIRKRLSEQRIDVAFTKHFELRNIANLHSIPAYAVTPSVLLPASHPLAREADLTISQLREESFVILELDECPIHTDSLVQMCIKEGFYPKIAKYANSNMTRIFYIHAGYGIALMDGEISLPPWADVAVVPMRSDLPSLQYDTYIDLAWRQDAANPVIDLFTQTTLDVVEELSTVPGPYAPAKPAAHRRVPL